MIEARIDSNGFQEIFKARTDAAGSKLYRPFDSGTTVTLDDPLELSIDGLATGTYLDKADATTGSFDSYVSTLLNGGSGSTLDIQVSWAGSPSGGEPMGIDNITINGTPIPEPSALIAVLLGLGGFLLRRRK